VKEKTAGLPWLSKRNAADAKRAYEKGEEKQNPHGKKGEFWQGKKQKGQAIVQLRAPTGEGGTTL